MMDKIIKFFDFIIKLPLNFLITFNVVLGVLLFSPEKLSKTLAIYEFVKLYRIYLGPAFILLFSILISKILVGNINRKKILKKRDEYLNSLTVEEKGYLSVFIKEEKNTICCAMGDGIAGGLVAKDIIYKASNIVNVLDGDAFNLHPWARKHLNKNIYLLDGASGRPLSNEEKLFGNRL